jgi:hypothetical protein
LLCGGAGGEDNRKQSTQLGRRVSSHNSPCELFEDFGPEAIFNSLRREFPE